MGAARETELLLLAGSYTRPMPDAPARGEGITSCWFNSATGELRRAAVLRDIRDPAYLAVDAARERVYAITALSESADGNNAAICALALEPDSGTLSRLNCRPARGKGACHVWTTGAGVLVACYAGGSISALPLAEDGSLLPVSSVVQHGEGARVNPLRQEGPHAHCILTDAAGAFIFVTDLGRDEVVIYRLEDGRLAAHGQVSLTPGSGPRHLVFHPQGRHAFVVNELSCSVTAFRYDAAAGALMRLMTQSTLPLDYAGFNTCAAIHVHPNGRFVYASNRGHDSIAVFEFDAGREALVQRSIHLSGGRTPRDFTLTPDGKWLLAAHQDSANVVTFRVDGQTGALEATGHALDSPAAVCLKWAQ